MSSRSDLTGRHTDDAVDRHPNEHQTLIDPEAPSRGQGGEAGPLTIGWREWVSLPELDLPAIKAKVDTGARTSAIHALDIKRFKHENGEDWVSFVVQPLQRDTSIQKRCQAPLLDIRKVTDSGGHSQERYFVSTLLSLGTVTRQVEITLSERRDMLFRMLLGRTSIVPDILVNPQLSYTMGRLKARSLYTQNT